MFSFTMSYTKIMQFYIIKKLLHNFKSIDLYDIKVFNHEFKLIILFISDEQGK